MVFELDIERLRHLPETPLRALKRSFWWVRKTFFSKPKPENPAVVVAMDEPEAEAFLGERFFEPGWEMSYSYRNEIVNLRRVRYVRDHPSGLEWWQTHIRGYVHPDGLELAAHFEPEPAEHPDAHVSGEFIDVPRGNATLVGILEDAGVGFQRIGDWGEGEETTDRTAADVDA
ncbi:hypothetical protein [Haloplanus halophilus]|uniref:hypothetical protein n=1 Tax=Haloplanus halophilus TaxID=2949993 RepID=UPI00203D0211|nr:hypothetical protein [Haloplanus sp. GDY1]